MLLRKQILAVVPARSGSKGIPHKNMRLINGISLIGWAGLTLGKLSFLDAKLISTDSADYAAEAKKYGLDAPFLRPAQLSTDQAGAVETLQHALLESEKHYKTKFEVILIVEPTSPLRLPEDIFRAASLLIENSADSVVTVSPLSAKSHPRKILEIESGHIKFFQSGGNQVKARQQLEQNLYWRNGICYALTRKCLLEKGVIFTDNTLPLIIERPVVNIDEPIELEWAEYLMAREASQVFRLV